MLARSRRYRAAAAVLAGLLAAFAVGYSSDDPPATSAAGGVTILAVQAGAQARPDGSLYFRQRTLRARAGRVSITLTNPASLGHNLAVRRNGQRLGVTATIASGASAPLSLRLQPGRYIFFCAVPGHEATGMRGALIVT